MANGLFTITKDLFKNCTLQECIKSDGEYEGYFSVDSNNIIPKKAIDIALKNADMDLPGIKDPVFDSATINFTYNPKRKTLLTNFMPSVYDRDEESEWSEPEDIGPYDTEVSKDVKSLMITKIKNGAA